MEPFAGQVPAHIAAAPVRAAEADSDSVLSPLPLNDASPGFLETSGDEVAAEQAEPKPTPQAGPVPASPASNGPEGILKRTRPVRTHDLASIDSDASANQGGSIDQRNITIGAVVAAFGATVALLGGAPTGAGHWLAMACVSNVARQRVSGAMA